MKDAASTAAFGCRVRSIYGAVNQQSSAEIARQGGLSGIVAAFDWILYCVGADHAPVL